MRPIDADRVYTSTAQVALTILLQNGDPMLIVELTRLLLQWLWSNGYGKNYMSRELAAAISSVSAISRTLYARWRHYL